MRVENKIQDSSTIKVMVITGQDHHRSIPSKIKDQRSKIKDQRSKIKDQRSKIKDQRSKIKDQRQDQRHDERQDQIQTTTTTDKGRSSEYQRSG
jgi:hypothetical protein